MVLTRHALRTLFFVFLYVMAMKTFLELMFMVLPTDLQPAALPWKRQEGGTEGRSNNASDERQVRWGEGRGEMFLYPTSIGIAMGTLSVATLVIVSDGINVFGLL